MVRGWPERPMAGALPSATRTWRGRTTCRRWAPCPRSLQTEERLPMLRISVPAEAASDPYGHAARTHAREIMAAAAGFSFAVYRETRLSLREFEAARMRTAQINGCMICQDFRAARDAEILADHA